MASELDQLYKHIDDIEIAMMTTRRPDGHLESRAMATQARAAGADLWFVTLEDTQKLRDLGDDPHVNLSYYKDRTREWISVSGTAVITRDRAKIHELYRSDWRAWFPKGDDPRHGTNDDPRMVLIGVTVHAAVFQVAKGWLTGSTPELGTLHHVER
jgi:general stress protein 26